MLHVIDLQKFYAQHLNQMPNNIYLGEIWKVFEDIQSQSVKQFRPMTMPLPRPVKPTSIYAGIDALAGISIF